MKTAVLAAASASLALVTALGASAQAQTLGSDQQSSVESPQNFALELRVGGFQPQSSIDAGTTPIALCPGLQSPGAYWDIFSARSPAVASASQSACDPRGVPIFPLFAVEFDWQIVRLGPVGSLGIGASVGFSSQSAAAPTHDSMDPSRFDTNATHPTGCSATTTNNPNCWTLSSENTTIDILPITAVAVLRFDGIARRVPWFPIVPYVKLGFAYSIWWVYKGADIPQVHSSYPPGTDMVGPAAGGSFGLHGAIGIAVMLDAFSPREARQLDANWGVNHSYLFAEGYLTQMFPTSILGRPQLNVGSLAWTFGLALEF